MKCVFSFLCLFLFGFSPVLARHVVFVSHKSSHGSGEHEYAAGCQLLGHWLKKAYPGTTTEHFINWPKDPESAFSKADTVVIFCSGGGSHLVNGHVSEFDQVMQRGVGLVCLHYAVEVPIGPSAKGMLNWMGGYFEANWSVNPHWKAEFSTLPEHPITQGVKPFHIDDEWYFHMRFQGDMKNVTPILSAIAPLSTMERKDGPHSGNPDVRKAVANKAPQHVAWAYERGEDYKKGRGFGFTGLHYHWNFENDNFRQIVLNAVAWTAKLEVPENGVPSSAIDREGLQKSMKGVLPGEEPQAAAKPLYRSKVINSNTPGYGVDIDVALKGARELFLVIDDGGNGYSCDWADWAEPRLVMKDNSIKRLTDLKWKRADADFGRVSIGKNVGGGELWSNGKAIPNGIGAHANSVIAYDLPEGVSRFRARGVLDEGGTNQQDGGATSVRFAVFTSDPGSAARPPRKDAPASRDPKEAVAGLDVHPELEATLFASEPMIQSPSSIDIDARGRVWLCEVVNYRGHNGKRPEGDRILILEDSDQDGRADKSTVFHQGNDVDSVHGICVLDNRVIVSAGEQVFSLYDDNRDDKSDRKVVHFTRIGGAQHDHGIHAFMFGPDGKLYFNFGNAAKRLCDAEGNVLIDKAGNKIEATRKPYQEGMVFRCDPDCTNVETLGWNFRNNWEVCVDSFGALWQSDNDDDGNKGVRINEVLRYGNYGYKDEITGAGWGQARPGMHAEIPSRHWHLNDPGVVPNLLLTGAGSPTGITVYEGSLLPRELRGQVIHCDAGPNVCRAYVRKPNGAGYSVEVVDLLKGTRDRWFRPSDVCVAPDGSLFVADWYDPGVGGHGMGDLERGRVFRLAPPKKAYAPPAHDFSKAKGLLKALRNPNNATRYLAWTGIRERAKRLQPRLANLAFREKTRAPIRARALWLAAEGDPALVVRALKDKNPSIRATALRISIDKNMAPLDAIAALVDDRNTQVRRECAIALRFFKSAEADALWARLALKHNGQDRWYLEALGIGADLCWDQRLAAYMALPESGAKKKATRDIVWRSRAKESSALLAGQLAKAESSEEATRMVRAFHFQPASAERDQAILQAFAMAGNEAALAMTPLLDPGSTAADATSMAKINRLAQSLAGEPDLVKLAGRFPLQDKDHLLLGVIAKQGMGNASVEAARLLYRENPDLVAGTVSRGDETALKCVQALGAGQDKGALEFLGDVLVNSSEPEEVRRAAAESMARSSQGGKVLLKLAEADKIPEAYKFQIGAAFARSRDRKLRDALYAALKLEKPAGGENLPPLAEMLQMRGQQNKGRLAFEKATCATCHQVGGEGIAFGPDLSEIGDKLSREGMYEAILYPDNAISHGFQGVMLKLSSGDELGGYITSENAEGTDLRMLGGVTRNMKTSEIVSKSELEISLMPAGLAGALNAQELADLVAYLTTLRK